MPVTPVYSSLAANVPQWVPCPMPLDVNAAYPATPLTYEMISQAQISDIPQALNRNSRRSEVVSQFGGAGAFARIYGLELSEDTGLLIAYSEGASNINGPQVKTADATLALDDETYSWVWITSAGTLSAVADPDPLAVPDPPTDAAAFLGRCRMVGGALTEIDYSGRHELRGGTLWRRTADPAEPTDSPPANIQFFQRSLNGLYWWDGYQYWPVSADTLIRLAPHRLTVPAAAMNYRIEADFSAAGEFADECLTICATCDEAGPIISQETNRQNAGRISLVLFVPTDSVPGTYGGILNLELNVAVKALGWTGASTTGIAASWTAPDPLT